VVIESSRTIRASHDDLAYQRGILPGVSRTFALTIPVLPDALAVVVTNAYLLCRIADTIEDDPGLKSDQKSQFHARFVAVVNGEQRAEEFARDLAPLLSDRVLPAEHDLVRPIVDPLGLDPPVTQLLRRPRRTPAEVERGLRARGERRLLHGPALGETLDLPEAEPDAGRGDEHQPDNGDPASHGRHDLSVVEDA